MLCRYSEFHAFAIFRQLADYVQLFNITLVTSLLLFKLVFSYVSIDRFRSFVQKVFLLAFINKSFSSRHKLHRFDPPLYAATCFIMDQLMWWSRFPIFNFQIRFDNSVSLACFTYRSSDTALNLNCISLYL